MNKSDRYLTHINKDACLMQFDNPLLKAEAILEILSYVHKNRNNICDVSVLFRSRLFNAEK